MSLNYQFKVQGFISSSTKSAGSLYPALFQFILILSVADTFIYNMITAI